MSTIGQEGRRRDEWYNEIEPDGSYGLCWKRLDSLDPATARCTAKPDHLGPCTAGSLTLETFRRHQIPVALCRGDGKERAWGALSKWNLCFGMSSAVGLWVDP